MLKLLASAKDAPIREKWHRLISAGEIKKLKIISGTVAPTVLASVNNEAIV